MNRFQKLAAILSALALAACGSESSLPEATGKGTLRAINAIKTSPEFAFLIEERSIDSLSYKEASSSSSWDDLNYTFNFDVLFFGDAARTRVASVNLDVVADKDYTFVISGDVAVPTITLWEGDVRDWGDGSTATEFRFGHLAASGDPVDVYLDAPGNAPVLGQQVGTIAFGEVLPAFEMTAGGYVLTIATAGADPADENNVLFVSNSFVTEPETSLLFSVFDGDANEIAPLAVRSFNATSGGTAALSDSRFAPTVRFFHASVDPAVAIVDVYIEDLLATPAPAPLLSGHAFEDITGDIEVPFGVLPVSYTTVDDIMVIHVQEDVSIAAAVRWNMYFVGEAGNPQIVLGRSDRRSVETVAKFTMLQTATNHALLDLYVVDRGVDISAEDVLPVAAGIPPSGTPLSSPLLAGSFDFYLTTSGEKTVVAGPYELDVALGDVVDLIVYDVTDNTAVAKIVAIPPPAPLP
jgi:hypothetical protein